MIWIHSVIMYNGLNRLMILYTGYKHINLNQTIMLFTWTTIQTVASVENDGGVEIRLPDLRSCQLRADPQLQTQYWNSTESISYTSVSCLCIGLSFIQRRCVINMSAALAREYHTESQQRVLAILPYHICVSVELHTAALCNKYVSGTDL